VKDVKAETTISVAGEPLSPEGDESKDVPVLVVAWSSEEPGRIGEVAFAGPLGTALVLGRGDEGEPDRVRFFRQRPQELVETGPIGGRGISRKQLLLMRFAAGIEVEQVGRCALLVNGAPATRAAVTVGDTIQLRGQLLLYCSARPRKLPAARYFPEDAWGPFGEPDALGMLGESPAMWRLRDRVAFAAKSGSHVLLRGESGTGKELAARAIHRLSARAAKPLVSRNAATFPAGLIDAELFGNVKNYPNPGTPERPGLIGQAHGGTLFLDEIGELPQEMQAHLLRVLDEGGDYQRLGEASARKSDLRLIGATNRPPESLKHDLLARLPVRVELDSLVDRREDIPLLVRHLVLRAAGRSPEVGARFVKRTDGRSEALVDAALVGALLRRRFTTNVRELDSLLWNAMGESRGDGVALNDAIAIAAPARPAEPPAAPGAAPPRVEPTAEAIRECVGREKGNIRRAAAALGLPSRYALYRLMRKHGIDVKGGEPE
jgi:two-component system nitrogen regulation response regulator GlnG/two-component system response regulator HydG